VENETKNTIHPLLAGASIVIIVAGLRAAASIVGLLLLAILLTTSIASLATFSATKFARRTRVP